MKKKLYAFTLAETLIVLCAIAFVMTITIANTVNSKSFKERQLHVTSETFYANVSNAFHQILLNEIPNVNLANMPDYNNDGVINSDDLKSYFVKYLEGDSASCNEISGYTPENIKSIASNARIEPACGEFIPKFKAAFYFDKTCSLKNVPIKEYFDPNNSELRGGDYLCGFIVFTFDGASEKELGKDVFLIGLGKSNIK